MPLLRRALGLLRVQQRNIQQAQGWLGNDGDLNCIDWCAGSIEGHYGVLVTSEIAVGCGP